LRIYFLNETPTESEEGSNGEEYFIRNLVLLFAISLHHFKDAIGQLSVECRVELARVQVDRVLNHVLPLALGHVEGGLDGVGLG